MLTIKSYNLPIEKQKYICFHLITLVARSFTRYISVHLSKVRLITKVTLHRWGLESWTHVKHQRDKLALVFFSSELWSTLWFSNKLFNLSTQSCHCIYICVTLTGAGMLGGCIVSLAGRHLPGLLVHIDSSTGVSRIRSSGW